MSQLPPRYYWRVVPSPVQYNLNAISGTGNSFIVGDNGTLLRSINSGWSYSIISGLLNYNLNDIKYDGNLNKYTAVGDNGTIYYFADVNIQTIILEPAGTTNNLFGIGNNCSEYVPPVFRRIAVGEAGTIIKSIWNIGTNWSSWTPVTSGTTQDLYSVDFYLNVSNNYQNVTPVGCAVGNNGTILRTTDCGDTWNSINMGITYKLNSFRFTDSMTCWITGSNGLLMKSTNRGLNWIIIPTGTSTELKSFRISNINWGLAGYLAYYVCGNNGLILQSINQGATWTSNQSFSQNNLNLISYSPYNSYGDAIVVGNSGTILHRTVDSTYYNYRILQGNNIKSYFRYSGIFDQNTMATNSPGFEWPKGSNKHAIFTAGLSIAAYYQGALREAMASYKGEFFPGICNNGIPHTGDTFKLYTVKRGDSDALNPDWNNWGLMVPYGAPFVDVNNNGIFEPQIDTPGVKNASQTIFLCCTDGFESEHNPGEGFGGGTLPLYSEVHLTAWCYSQPSYADMQFLKFVVINKSNQPWTKTYFALVSDADLGNPNDDYTGCDTVRDLGYVYNGTNNDQIYGTAPPAAGFLFLKGPYNKSAIPPEEIGIISSFYFCNPSACGIKPCETDPNGEPNGAYLFMKGYKKDSTCWLDPTYNPPKKTKVIYPGDPETNTGWTMANGCILNCNRDTTGQLVIPVWPHDMKIGFGSGAENLTVMPGDTQTIVICQLIARGSSNLNSVTKLKQLADLARDFYNSGYVIDINKIGSEVPTSFSLGQNYPNPFNPTTKIKFEIPENFKFKISNLKLVVYDILGKEVVTLVNEKLQPGTYEVTFDGSNYASGIYFYQLRTDEFIETKKLILLK